MSRILLLIPVFKPGIEFIDLINKTQNKFFAIIIINDGSGQEYESIFTQIKQSNVVVLRHEQNRGKGNALKTGLKYILQNYPDYNVVTADCDGQHLVEDIINCANNVSTKELVLGVRRFDNDNMPILNRLGNSITRFVFNKMMRLKVSDTQTGLRAFDNELIKQFVNIPGDRFEYETNMLIYCKNNNIPIKEVPIKTIYDHNDYQTHFNKIKDSISIYRNIFKNNKQR